MKFTIQRPGQPIPKSSFSIAKHSLTKSGFKPEDVRMEPSLDYIVTVQGSIAGRLGASSAAS